MEFFFGEDAGARVKTSPSPQTSLLSSPLMGARQAAPPPLTEAGTGGPVASEEPALSSSQDNALVASRNPLGTLPGPAHDQIFIYKVEDGDTVSAIAERFGISVSTILWANNIKSAISIKAGDELVILPVSGVQYEVKKGDTIEAIAKRFKGEVNDILSFNGLAVGEDLEVGEMIIIPDGESQALPIKAAPPTRTIRGIPARFANLPDYGSYYIRPIGAGSRSRGFHGHNGVDLADSCGTPVLASAAGTVIVARASGWNGGYGKYIVVNHENGTQTLYGHLSGVKVVLGQAVNQGAVIGLLGTSGNSTGCHIHFEVRGAKNPF